MSNNINNFMSRAIELSMTSVRSNGGPFGCVIVKNNKIIAEGYNKVAETNDPTAHAEIQALRAAGQSLKNYRFNGATLYVTLEPCPMCAGALVNARVARLVFGAADLRVGAAGTVFDIVRAAEGNHRLDVTGGVLESECRELLQAFFRARRRD